MTSQYVHLELNKEVDIGIAGYYTPQREVRLKYHGKEVLCVVGQAVVESWCCGGDGRWSYAIVPGFINKWQSKKDSSDRPVSEVEPVSDDETRQKLRDLVRGTQDVLVVDFW